MNACNVSRDSPAMAYRRVSSASTNEETRCHPDRVLNRKWVGQEMEGGFSEC